MKHHASLVALALSLGCASASAHGFAPDAGSLMANTQASLADREVQPQEGYPLEYYPKLRWTDEFSIRVQSVSIQGNTLMPEEKLQLAVKGFVGKRLVVEKLSTVSAAVNKAYRDAGYRVKAYIPDQSFAHGRLVVQVIEAANLR
jgi:hemolysin activation/secretion protein